MPGRAFIPGPLAQAQPRVYKSFRARQAKGLMLSAAGAGLSLLIFGGSTLTGYLITFIAATPGLAYGYFEPEGKPVEYWLRVMLQYHLESRVLTTAPLPSWWRRSLDQAGLTIRATIRAAFMRRPKEVSQRG